MKVTAGRAIFGVLLGVVGGVSFGLIARAIAERVIRSEYNGLFYIENGSVLPLVGVAIAGLIAGSLVPSVNRRLWRLVFGAGVWTLGTLFFLCLPFVYANLLIPGMIIGACSLISALGGTLQGVIAAWVDLP